MHWSHQGLPGFGPGLFDALAGGRPALDKGRGKHCTMNPGKASALTVCPTYVINERWETVGIVSMIAT